MPSFKKKVEIKFGLCNANSLPVNADVLNEPIIHVVAAWRNCLLIAKANSTTSTFAILDTENKALIRRLLKFTKKTL